MHFKLLSDADLKAMDALLDYHGGAKEVNDTIIKMRGLEVRKKILADNGFGKMIDSAENLVKKFPKVSEFEKKNNIQYNDKFGKGTAQVSGWQGAKVTHQAMKRIAATNGTDEPCFVPSEFISVVALTDNYIYNGDLMATLAMSENLMKCSKFCSTNLIGIPMPETRFEQLEKVTGKVFPRADMGNSLSAVTLKNQGTFFGNFGGIEVANDNHLIYLDGVTRTAKANGADFFLNPSWSSIIAACYYGKNIPALNFKISMLLATQNLMQFRMLLNIMKEYLREDGTSPLYEINIGNGTTAETFIQAAKELKASGIKGISLAAHIYINPDLGAAGFNWTDNMYKVLESGTDMTYKYESDGTARELDTMEAYFMSEEDRDANAEKIGDVIFYKSMQASRDGIEMMKKGIKPIFGGSSY
ncbi:MAG: hypothetical protein K9N09_05400 [Candidatus Cloacimonetes bacterium]|nr:hypothetical protein [Candidatus Cloacimonadota bacterium]MCF7814222.1 hypothetical protein [Candidatus Cloacimonadota bacterium]MCF7868119.1 hypothetical protein [Candidatus Cloacimonadota bacterium]MCF7883585.1 hypothetical protein [Candidatus Cloacimonadota bacterium]